MRTKFGLIDTSVLTFVTSADGAEVENDVFNEVMEDGCRELTGLVDGEKFVLPGTIKGNVYLFCL